jgi:hypothetical protein
MRTIRYLFIFLIAFLALGSCRKIVTMPPVPNIEFTSFAVFDSIDPLGNRDKAGRLKFYFEDGDGDLGLDTPTGGQADTTNLYLTLFRKKTGIMDTITDKKDPLLPYSAYRIPYMERLGQNKLLKGTISVTFLYMDYAPGDTIKYDFYIIDRALNPSNLASTSEIVISVNGIYSK